MSTMETEAVVVLRRLRVENANIISSPLTWGFPSPTAFTGFSHALERHLQADADIRVVGTGIVCHGFDPQVHKPAGKYERVLRLSRDPVTKSGTSASLVERGRGHLDVSIVLALCGDGIPLSENECSDVAESLLQRTFASRIAGGSVVPRFGRDGSSAEWMHWPEDSSEQRKALGRLRQKLFPGFVLVSRADVLGERVAEMQEQEPAATSLDALLDLSALHVDPPDEDPKRWRVSRRKPGWLVPIPVGYQRLGDLHDAGAVANSRDDSVPFAFAESVLSLGEWVGPHRVKRLEGLLWRHQHMPDAGLYLVENKFQPEAPAQTHEGDN